MAPVPRDVLLNSEIQILDGQILLEWGRIGASVKEWLRLNPLLEPSKDLFGEFTRVRNLMTRRHALELERTYPGRQVIYQPRLWGAITIDEGKKRKAVELRIPDVAVVLPDGSLWTVEVKTEKELLASFSADGEWVKVEKVVEGKKVFLNWFLHWFKDSSRIQEGLQKQARVLEWVQSRGMLWVEGFDAVTLLKIEWRFSPFDVRASVQSYKNMGDGIDLSPAPPDVSGKGPTGPTLRVGPKGEVLSSNAPAKTNRTATDARGVKARGVDARSLEGPKLKSAWPKARAIG